MPRVVLRATHEGALEHCVGRSEALRRRFVIGAGK
ncbi:MAG: hypothetical protein ACLQLT_03105 [Methylovirgula sp.]